MNCALQKEAIMAVLQETVELLAEKHKNDGEVQGVAGNSQQE